MIEHDTSILSLDSAIRFVGDPELLVEITEMLLEELPEQMGLIDQHWNNRDLTQLSKTAHRLKGNFGIVCAAEAQAAAKQLEHVAKEGNEAQAEPAVNQLVAAVDRVTPLLEKHVAAAS